MSLNGNILDYFVAFFSGVLVSFTPCVYPLLPVTAAYIAGANTSGRRWSGFALSLLYVLGLAISYSALAVVAVLTGKVFGVFQQSPWVSLVIGNILLFFAFVMFDVIPFPTLRIGRVGKPGNPLAVLLFGMISGLMVGPCTAPVLGTLLIHVASRQNMLFAVSLIFVFACGFGASLILAGTFGGFLASLLSG